MDVLTVLSVLAAVIVGAREGVAASCDPIRIEMCRGLGYNVTSMPNLVGHELQQDAEMQLQTFSPLIQYGCSSQLRFFLCSVYVPMCTDKVPDPIGPCRGLCNGVRHRCQPVLQEFGFPWPAALNCSKFPPENNQKHMCMDGPGEEAAERDPYFPRRPYSTRTRISNSAASSPTNQRTGADSTGGARRRVPAPDPCSHYKNGDLYVYVNRTERCMPLCQADILFRMEDKQFAGVWVAVWAILCFVTTLLTVLTFLVDSPRFRFPERPIVFLAITYNLYSIGHLVRLAAGREDIACHVDGVNGGRVLVQEGLSHTNCAIVFLLLYYFGMAACVWWVILTITWYLAAALRWTHETIERYSSYFHVAAWAIPAAQSIAALVMRVVDADELTGTCFVGQHSVKNLFIFVVVPHFLYLVIGSGFLIFGFSKLRNHQKTVATSKAGVFLVRIGIFSCVCLVPALYVLGTNLYEYLHREQWLMSGETSRPNLEVFMLKIFMLLVIGIMSGMWIWSRKTLDTWKQLGRRLVSHRKQQPTGFLLAGKHLIVLDTRMKVPLAKNGSETAV